MQLLQSDGSQDAIRRSGNTIKVCSSPSCELKGQIALIRNIEETLGIRVGESSADGRFHLQEIPCPGYCEKAPMFIINEMVFEELNPDEVSHVLNTYLMTVVGGR